MLGGATAELDPAHTAASDAFARLVAALECLEADFQLPKLVLNVHGGVIECVGPENVEVTAILKATHHTPWEMTCEMAGDGAHDFRFDLGKGDPQ